MDKAMLTRQATGSSQHIHRFLAREDTEAGQLQFQQGIHEHFGLHPDSQLFQGPGSKLWAGGAERAG